MKQSPHQSAKCTRTLGIAQEAASALASIRKDAESIKRKMHRPPSLGKADTVGGRLVTSTPHTSQSGGGGGGGAFKPPINRSAFYVSVNYYRFLRPKCMWRVDVHVCRLLVKI